MTNLLKILNYHNVDVPPPGAQLTKLYVTPTQFAAQCRVLQRLGLRGVTLTEGLSALAKGDAHRCVALTFDDGYADNLTHAAPVLREFGFRATCFIVAGRIGAHNDWDASILGVQKPLMAREQLQSWLAENHEIGAHTMTHARLPRLSRDAAYGEIVMSRVRLKHLTGSSVDHFCYPYGDFSTETADLVRLAGYRSAVTTMRGLAHDADDPFRLPRISIDGRKGLFKFALKTATSYAGWGRRRAA